MDSQKRKERRPLAHVEHDEYEFDELEYQNTVADEARSDYLPHDEESYNG